MVQFGSKDLKKVELSLNLKHFRVTLAIRADSVSPEFLATWEIEDLTGSTEGSDLTDRRVNPE